MSLFRPPGGDADGGVGGVGEAGDDLKSLQEQKLKSFSIGQMGRRGLSKKEQEEQRKKMEQEEVGKVYKEFVSQFEDSPSSKLNKTWVKAGTFNAGSRHEDQTDKGKLYKPSAKLQDPFFANRKEPEPSPDALKSKRPEKPGKKKQQEKKKSNLEIFKEELKARQEEREERHRIKGMLPGRGGSGSGSARDSEADSGSGGRRSGAYYQDMSRGGGDGSHDNGDPNTTNLYLGNLSPKLTEQAMMELFGKYGPLASIKIMWPRTEDEKSRGRNCGFVAYMSRVDGERALDQLSGKMIDGFEMKMGWGKPIPIPLHPIYVPPALMRFTLPPPPSGLPFNAQPGGREDAERWNVNTSSSGQPPPPIATPPADSAEFGKFQRMLYRCSIKVVIPTDRTQLCLINRMVEFVLREGPMFEAMIMNREMRNRHFAFLFENQSPEHIYYRWRLYSMLQGDTRDTWYTEPFRMFKGGSLWKPPPMNLYTAGMPEELVGGDDDDDADRGRQVGVENLDLLRSSDKKSREEAERNRGKKNTGLSDSQRDRFEDMLRNLYPDRNPLAETMVWCIEHADAGEEIVECISEALSILQTPLAKKVARLYLISDILHNCSVKGVPNVSYYRKGFQAKLPEVFADLHAYYAKLADADADAADAGKANQAEAFKTRVMSCFRAWEDWALYPQDYLIRLQNVFLGLVGGAGGGGNGTEDGAEDGDNNDPKKEAIEAGDGADDGAKSNSDEDDDVDGIPLDGAALLKSAQKGKLAAAVAAANRAAPGAAAAAVGQSDSDSDVDGTPILPAPKPTLPAGDQSRRADAKAPANPAPGFVPSKWETVDPEEVQAQAVTSKWDIFEAEKDNNGRKRKGVNEPDDEDDEEDIDGIPLNDDDPHLDVRLSEDRRARLREIELKVMCYQDELESGKQTLKPGWTISEQIDRFRKRLLKQAQSSSYAGGASNSTPSTAAAARTPDNDRTPRGGASSRGAANASGDDDDKDYDSGSRSSSRKSRKSKKSKRRRSSSSSRSRSRSRDRDRDRDRDRKGDRDRERNSGRRRKRSRSRSSSNSEEESSRSSRRRSSPKRSSSKRSRSRSPKRHKKKSRH